MRSLAAVALLVAGGVLVSAQGVQLPSAPQKQFGTSITPAYEGWFDNADGTHSLLVGYYNRNTNLEVDIPIGPNNHMEPGAADQGQPTHFLPLRRFGMFVITLPKEATKTTTVTWTLTYNSVTTSIPLYMHTDYNLTPMKSTEESPDGTFNEPPLLRFAATGPNLQGPAVMTTKALARTATVGAPMPLDLWVDDDARYSSGGNGPMGGSRPPVTLMISKYRGPGTVKVAEPRAKVETLKGGKPMEPFSGKASTTATFSEPGEYILHVTANDFSGNGGGGSGCCWTNAMIKVTVSGGATTRGQ
jgi:hypothetical protein